MAVDGRSLQSMAALHRLFTSVTGIISAELSGHLTTEKWRTSADELVDTLVAMIELHAKE